MVLVLQWKKTHEEHLQGRFLRLFMIVFIVKVMTGETHMATWRT